MCELFKTLFTLNPEYLDTEDPVEFSKFKKILIFLPENLKTNKIKKKFLTCTFLRVKISTNDVKFIEMIIDFLKKYFLDYFLPPIEGV